MKLLLVDGHYYVYRSFFAIRELTNSHGEPTNAIYGFVKTMRRMVKDLRPDLGAVVWDEGLASRRMVRQPAYKQQREEMPDAMREQLGFIRGLVPAMGLGSVGLDGMEADDVIASYTVAARERGIEVVLATNDKDLFQLVGPGVSVYSTAKADVGSEGAGYALLGAEAVRAKWGVEPVQIGDVLALVGDSADNIPGVPGVGVKTAAGLLREHGTLEGLYGNLSAVKSERVRAELEKSKVLVFDNREMVRLDLDLPLPVGIDALALKPDYGALAEKLERCEFRSLLAEVRAEAAAARPVAECPVQAELF